MPNLNILLFKVKHDFLQRWAEKGFIQKFSAGHKNRNEHAELGEDDEGEQRLVAPEGVFAASQQKDKGRGEGEED